MEDIHEGNINGNECIIINLEYLGTYEYLLKQENDYKNNIKISFVEYFKKQNYTNKLIENNMFGNYKNINSEETEEKKENVILSKIKRKIKEKFDIDINEEINGEKNEINIMNIKIFLLII